MSYSLKRTVATGFFVFAFLSQCDVAFSNELMSSADLMSSGSWRMAVYGLTAENKSVVETGGTEAIRIPVSGGGESVIFSDANYETEMEGEYNGVVAALTFRPRNGLHYRVKVGQIRDYKLSYSSGSQTNALEALSNGIVWGVGMRWNIAQDTPVSTAIALDLSYERTEVGLDRFQGGADTVAVNQKWEQDQFQGAINFSRRFKWIEPYGGLKLSRLVSRLKDNDTKEALRGTTDVVSPFVGLNLEIFEKEFFTLEASFVDESIFSAGVNLAF